jgi:HSP20 family protein
MGRWSTIRFIASGSDDQRVINPAIDGELIRPTVGREPLGAGSNRMREYPTKGPPMTDIEKSQTQTPSSPSTPTRWDPFAELESWLNRPSWSRLPWPTFWNTADDIDFTPAADIEETDDAWKVDLELPGVAKKDIEVETHGRTVVIHGERKDKERTGVMRQRRRVTGSFRYEVTLPGDLDLDAIEASLDDGELVVTIPKAVAEQPRKVKIS